MKISLLILATALAVANAGVGVLGPREIEEAMRLFFQHCGGNSEGGSDGNTYIYCKKAREPEITRDAQHELVVTPAPEAARQVVFVQPPDYLYRHQIQIKGGQGQAQQTRIYVLPPKINHQVAYDDVRQGGPGPSKPQLFFLNDQPGGSQGGNNGGQQGGNNGGQQGGNGPYDPRYRSNDQYPQAQQLAPSAVTSDCGVGSTNPNCAPDQNSNNNNNNNAAFGASQTQTSFGGPQVQPPQSSASSINQIAARAPANYRPIRQYLPRIHPLSVRG